MSRRARLAVALPLVLVLLAVGAKTLGMSAVATWGVSAYDRGGYAAAAGWFSKLGVANVIEPYVAPFDGGDATYAEHDYAGATRDFTAALRLAPPQRRCPVRVNLVLTHESAGDAAVAAKDLTVADARYHQGLAATEATCIGTPKTRLQTARARILAKIKAIESHRSPKPRSGRKKGTPSGKADSAVGRAERLQSRNQAGARQEQAARDGQQLSRHLDDKANDRPW